MHEPNSGHCSNPQPSETDEITDETRNDAKLEQPDSVPSSLGRPGVAFDPDAARDMAQKAGRKAYEASREAAREALDVTREAAMTAFQAATVVFTDPMGGQGKAMRALGEQGSLMAGSFFTALFVLFFYLCNMGGGFGNHVAVLGLGAVLAATLTGCFRLLGRLHDQDVTSARALFSCGVTLFPMAAFLAIAWLHIFSGWILTLLFFYAFCLVLLLINGYLLDVLHASTRYAIILSPTVLLAVIAVGYLYGRLFGPAPGLLIGPFGLH